MLARKRSCFRYLKHLSLHSYPRLYSQPRFGDVLATLLTRATELETLCLSSCDILKVDQRVEDAFVQMKSLRVLKICQYEDDIGELLARMRTPLVCADVSVSHNLDPADPVPMLSPFKDTLRHLRVSWVDFMSAGTQFPHLTSLEAELCEAEGLAEIVQCFPALQDLYMDTPDEERWSVSEAEELRAVNSRLQAAHTWPSLNSLSGSVVTLYVLGVRCHVAHINISCDIIIKPVEGERLAAVLADARPTRLSLRLRASEFDIMSLAQYLLPVKDSLAKLELHVEFRGEQYEDPSPQIYAMLDTLSFLSLRTIDIWVNWTQIFHISQLRFSPDAKGESLEVEDPGQSIAGLDLAAIGLQAARSIPTLQLAIVDGGYPLRTKVFKISRDADDSQATPTMVELEYGNADREVLLKEKYMQRAAVCHPSCSMYP
ncbi:hypothetical protein PsYK624_042050 [Phanerochaete sordida]|uniref:F-box domain-containing protein n=1 Tax=Phanerochaete sordida TaxID=48140 RepID=A0A9P3LBS0_9APHY|nr:hypothetical protein PsYK624_042050 [Phanerochaete sordida]